MTVFIKYMVCIRCIMAVRSVLDSLSLSYSSVELGKANITQDLSDDDLKKLDQALQHYELELMADNRLILVERIKTSIHEILRGKDGGGLKLSAHLNKTLNYDYAYLSNIFSALEHTTIERFYILNRIERVKEMLVYDDLSLTQIADALNFSNVAHLSLQFKKLTGKTASEFKKACLDENFIWKNCK